MSTNPTEPRREYPNTYIVQDRSNQEEMARLTVQDQMATAGMGGVLAEQPDPTIFHRILDVGCGTGSWLIQVAKEFPTTTRLVGADASAKMMEYARKEAQAEQVSDRVEFQVMDALLILEFPENYFDLVNERFAGSFMRTWNWPKLLDELQRVTRPGGIIRLTEVERVNSNSPSHLRLLALLGEAFYRSGHLFAESKVEGGSSVNPIGVGSESARLLRQYGVKNVQTRASLQEFHAGSPVFQHFIEDTRLTFQTVVPFLRKWSHFPDDYETIYQQMLKEIQQPNFMASWNLVTAWGTKTSQPYV